MSELASLMPSNTFVSMVETRVHTLNMGYLEAIVDVCEKAGIEIESVSKLMTPTMRKLLSAEATKMNLMKRTGSRLPI
jgi:hypothetical protein